MVLREFPGCLWLGLCALTAEGLDSVPGQGTKIPQVAQVLLKGKKEQTKTKKMAVSLQTR